MPTKPDVGIRNVVTQRWATSWVQIRPTTAHAVLRCFAASTCWSGGEGTGGYTLSTARSVVSAKVMGRSKPIRSDSVRPATSGYVAPTVRKRGITRTQGPRRPHGLPNALPRLGLAPQWQTYSAIPNGSLDHNHQLLRSKNSKSQSSNPRPQAKRNSPQRRRPRILTNSRSQYSSPLSRVKRKNNQGRRPRIPTNSKRQ